MKSAFAIALVLTALTAHAASTIPSVSKITIDKKTTRITPSEQIHQFDEIDWDKVEQRQDAGKQSGDSIVMMCDDTYLEAVEVKLPEGLSNEISFESDCKLRGANHEGDLQPAWIQFDGPDSGHCTIKVQKSREGGKTPLVVEYELADAC